MLLQITSVTRNKKNKDMLSIYIDDKYAFGMSESDFITMNLYDKRDITAEEIEYIRHTLNFRSAKAEAVKYLAIKLRTEDEVEKKLSEKGFDHEAVINTISELKALGYINNRLFAQKYIFDRSKLKPISKKLLKFELLHKGINEAEIDEALEEWNVDEPSVARNLARKKFGKYDLSDEKMARRAYSFLRHRGFDHELAMQIIEELKLDK